ncbi:hypothetical protein A8C32_17705 [Flavivirga aquatica]|uniref:Uncharacterized protein n=1 Tax=Flavivirga aquatica TaxID=1849968 RepID=A0A1E5T8C7_9FLAO|nr:hypothetical protein A8C32_17705 [Flavivirga aquatica]
MSGVILFSDKILNYYNVNANIEFRYYLDLESFIWHVSQTISPIIILLAFALWLKNRIVKYSLLAPLSIYSIQVMYILRDEHYIAKDYFWFYTIFFVVTLIFCYYFLSIFIKKHALKVSLLKLNIKDLISYIFKVEKDKTVNENEMWNVLEKVSDE